MTGRCVGWIVAAAVLGGCGGGSSGAGKELTGAYLPKGEAIYKRGANSLTMPRDRRL